MVDYHVHLENGPYTLEWLSLFIETGIKRGLKGIGFVEHGHRFREARGIVDNSWADDQCTQRTEDFVNLVSRAKEQGYPIEILLGVEMDFVPGKEARIAAFLEGYPWDFVLGSVHWDGSNPLDWPGLLWREDGILPVYRKYFRLVKDMADTGLYDIAAHFDLVKVNGQRPPGIAVEKMEEAIDAVRAIAHAGMALEVSSAGLRKPISEIYPSLEILRLVRSMEVPIVFSSDAHYPGDVGASFDDLAIHARSAGYDIH